MSSKLDWSERYCVEKFLPLLTKLHLQDHVPCRTIRPIEIKKKRNPRGIPSYEVLWSDISGQYDALIPDDQFEEGEDTSVPWISTERQDLMRQYYPSLVEQYEESIKKPPKEKKGRKKKEQTDNKSDKPKRKYNRKPKQVQDIAMSILNDSLKNMSISKKPDNHNSSKANVTVSVNKLKRKLRNKTKIKMNTIESYLRPSKKRKSKKDSFYNTKNSSIVKTANQSQNCFNDKENSIMKHNLSIFDMSEVQDSDLSDIVDQIVSRPPTVTTAKVNSNLVKLIFENKQMKSVINQFHQNCSTPKGSPIRSFHTKRRSSISKINTSHFFDKLTDERDAFEISLQYKDDVVVDSNDTLDYSLPDLYLY